jgi:hypothetical protein
MQFDHDQVPPLMHSVLALAFTLARVLRIGVTQTGEAERFRVRDLCALSEVSSMS